eukprot:superscaffoldBa00000279_g3446
MAIGGAPRLSLPLLLPVTTLLLSLLLTGSHALFSDILEHFCSSILCNMCRVELQRNSLNGPMLGEAQLADIVPHCFLTADALVYHKLQCVCTAAEVRYRCQSDAFDHVCTTVSEHKHHSFLVDMPMAHHVKKQLADVVSSMGARHGLNI